MQVPFYKQTNPGRKKKTPKNKRKMFIIVLLKLLKGGLVLILSYSVFLLAQVCLYFASIIQFFIYILLIYCLIK